MTEAIDSGRRGGFILVTVLMGIALLAGIAATLTIASRTDLMFSTALVETARAEAAADAGAALAIEAILSGAFSPDVTGLSKRVANGEAMYCRFEDSALAVSVVDESGKVDINAASPDLLAALIGGVLSDETRASNIAAAIADFGDADDIDRASGGRESEHYAGAQAPGPKNTWFAAIDELEQVRGLDEELADGKTLFDHVRPYVTVWSRRTGIDPKMTPPGLVGLLSHAGDALAQQASIVSEARFYTVTVNAITRSGGRFSREITIERDPNAAGGYRTRSFLARPFAEDGDIPGFSHAITPCPAA